MARWTNACTGVRSVVRENTDFRFLVMRSVRVALLVIAFSLVSSACGQSMPPMRGTVVTKDGQPIAGVSIFGSVWKRCCPYQQDTTTTDDKGKFHLEHPGTVLHFSKAGFQPLVVIVKPGTSQVRIVMTLPENSLTVATCGQSGANEKQLGWGKYGLHFTVPKEGVKVLGGNVDTDYVRYVVKLDKSDSYLSLWFGPYSIAAEPDDEQFVSSASFSQRNLISVKNEVIGKDSSGQLNSGLKWRHTGAFGSGAVYQNATEGEAAVFDKIINSFCMVSYPNK